MVARNLRRAEILDFLQRDFPQYAWSLGTLSRRMKHFGIKFIDYDRTVDEVREAFQAEKKGPGQLLGYRAMHKRIREQHGLHVPRGLVYDVMTLDDNDGLLRRRTIGKKRRRGPVGTFTSLVRVLLIFKFCFLSNTFIFTILSILSHLTSISGTESHVFCRWT